MSMRVGSSQGVMRMTTAGITADAWSHIGDFRDAEFGTVP